MFCGQGIYDRNLNQSYQQLQLQGNTTREVDSSVDRELHTRILSRTPRRVQVTSYLYFR